MHPLWHQSLLVKRQHKKIELVTRPDSYHRIRSVLAAASRDLACLQASPRSRGLKWRVSWRRLLPKWPATWLDYPTLSRWEIVICELYIPFLPHLFRLPVQNRYHNRVQKNELDFALFMVLWMHVINTNYGLTNFSEPRSRWLLGKVRARQLKIQMRSQLIESLESSNRRSQQTTHHQVYHNSRIKR